jgi:hypothetical protein
MAPDSTGLNTRLYFLFMYSPCTYFMRVE